MDRILVVDASPLIYSVFNSVGHLSSKGGEPTGLRYGFVRGVRSYQERTKSDKVVICFDSPGQVIKAKDLPHYKSNRVFTDQKAEMYGQVPALREMLDLTKWTQLDAPGYEADDLIGALARAKGQRGHQVTIVSPDNDLMQLVDHNVQIFRPGSSKKRTKDKTIRDVDVHDTYGVHPEYLCLYRAIVGDASDNIPSLLTGANVKAELQSLFHRLGRRWKAFTPDDLDPLLDETHQDSTLRLLRPMFTLRMNFAAMSLPTPPKIDIRKGQKDRDGLERLFKNLEFASMLKHVDELTGETLTASLDAAL